MCLKSRSDQESLVSLKRGEKVTESPSLAEQREANRGKRDDQVERAESKLNLSSITKAKVESGQEMRVIFDNFDFRILANIILRNHRNSDMHWIAQYVTFNRVPSSHLDDSQPILPDIKDYIAMTMSTT